ncbi:nuclear transport factor 2 family protein [Flagellimonas sp. CMM7]|uniref:nuclear transport factor 2 family protein n=1 Tax=Flagellimonas sp. CMM7 TaxID=2654676 RepID=UPI0013D01A66|nr:nuclear transport factor 2 family protein [Flagellimonas sp. CMM7]UII79419.1 nuclear transport factor 2 family protein [Flagellimonas sp. CMM7]
MNPEEFIESYETALGTQDWKAVEPLVSKNVSVTFSNGTIHIGKENVQKAFEKNFSSIKNEKYAIENIKWLVKDQKYAIYLFEFNWTGIIEGKSASGNGIGTSVLIKEDFKWKLLTEHLGRKAD